jgi:hypothetical protein
MIVVAGHPGSIERIAGTVLRDLFLPRIAGSCGAAKAGLVVREDGRAAASHWILPRLDPWFVRFKKARCDAGSPASTCGFPDPCLRRLCAIRNTVKNWRLQPIDGESKNKKTPRKARRLLGFPIVAESTRLTSIHSHSIVAGGLPEMSYTTRLIPRTSLMIRFDTCPSRSCGRCAQCAVMKSSVCTARSATTYS